VVGISQIEWRVVDGAGNVATCLQAMTVSDDEDPVISCAGVSPFTRSNTLDLCGYIVEGTEFDATALDNCGSVVLTNNYNGQSSLGGLLLPVGTTIVVWTATDANGNTDACTIEIEVEDTQDPVFITCPPNVTLSLAPGGCETVLTWSIPVAEDNCGIASIVETSLGGPYFGTQQGVGTYDIEYTATDLYGNEETCTFTITVEDTQGPILACPSNAFVNTNVGCTYVSLAGQFDPILTIDNCPGIVLEHSLDGGTTWVVGPVPAGTVFALGTTTIQYRLTDNGNQFELCQFSVTVSDDDAPVITCPGGLTGEVDASCVYVFSPNLAEANVTDNCDVYGALTITYRVFGPDNSVSGYIDNGDPFDFVVGISQIEWRVVDGAGNESTCLQAMTVSDDEDPVITCPTDIDDFVRSNTPDLCGYIVQGVEFDATADDNCEVVSLTHNYGAWGNPNSLAGATFPVGTTVVVWMVVDGSGNSTSCDITIVVTDTQAPVFVNCPNTTFTISTDGNCSNEVIWAIPIATDNCGTVTVVETSSGGPYYSQSLAPGTYNIQYTATDGNMNTATCNFTVEVVDDNAPLLVCQPDLTVGTDDDECSWASLADQLNPLLAVDNCPGFELSYEISGVTMGSGMDEVPVTVFNLGVSTITYTLTDSTGNTSTCTFAVTVVDDEAPVIAPALCNQTFNVSADEGQCQSAETILISDFVSDNCTSNQNLTYQTVVLNPAGNLVVVGGSSLNYNFQVGVSISSVTVTDQAGNVTTCSFSVIVTDNELPVITCPESDLIIEGDCPASVEINSNSRCIRISWLEVPSSLPTLINNGLVNFSYQSGAGTAGNPALYKDVTFGGICSQTWGPYSGVIIIEDEICIFENGGPIPNYVFERNSTSGVCGYVAQDGEFDAVATDNCEVVSVSHNYGPWSIASSLDGATFPVGETVVTWTAVDASGNSRQCTITIVVEDTQAPVFVNCPAGNLVFVNDVDQCSRVVNFSTPVASDNCAGVIVTQTMGDPSGTAYPVGGPYTIEFTATDAAGLTATCQFTITVNDGQAPTAVCQDLVIDLDADGVASIVAADVDAGSSDNCSVASIAINDDSFDCDNVGDNLVVLTVTDLVGNTAICVSTVTVRDLIAPTFMCPADVTVNSCLDVIPDLVAQVVDAADNCGVATILQSVPAGSVVGLTDGSSIAVTITVTDVNGNIATCDVNVSVLDTTPPTWITCPQDVTFEVSLWPNDCEGGVIWPIPVAQDDCGGDVTVNQTDGPLLGTTLGVGTYEIVYEGSDAAGNTIECSFTIEVIDTEEPIVICPPNLTVGTDTGECEWASPVGSLSPLFGFANCDFEITYEITGATTANGDDDASGESFSLGLSTITYTITEDSSMQTLSCSFMVLVVDDEAPVILCPADIAVDNDPGICGAIVEFDAPIVEDNCPLPIEGATETFVFSENIETWTVPAGITSIEVEVCGAQGGLTSGGGGACLTVELPVTPGDVLDVFAGAAGSVSNGSLCNAGEGGQASYIALNGTPLVVAAGGGGGMECPSFGIAYAGGAGNDGLTSINGIRADNSFSWGTAGAGGNGGNAGAGSWGVGGGGGWFTPGGNGGGSSGGSDQGGASTGEGQSGGVFAAGSGGGYNGGGGADMASGWGVAAGSGGGSYYTGTLITSSAGSNMMNGRVTISYAGGGSLVQTGGLPSGSVFPVGTTTNTFLATDAAGNTAMCSFDVVVTDDEAPSILCPDNVEITTSNLGTLGDCAGQYEWNHPAATDNCGISLYDFTYTNPDGTIDGPFTGTQIANGDIPATANRNFQVGITTVSYFTQDAAGNAATCSFTVTVVDDEVPTFVNCPAGNLVFVNDVDQCSRVVNFSTPVASDNCAGVLVEQTMGGPSGTAYPVGGPYTIEFTATDAAGLTATCQFTITVNDGQAPTAVCQDLVIDLDADGVASIVAADVDAGSSDNCSVASIAINDDSFDCDNVGDNLVVLTVTDLVGNTAICVSTVTVRDLIAPTFMCPADVTVNSCLDVIPDLVAQVVDAADNCGVATILQNVPAGSIVGLTDGSSIAVTITVTDVNGNIATCDVNVSVLDTTPPTWITCPQDVTFEVSLWPNDCEGGVIWPIPVAQDDCEGEITANQTGGPLLGTTLDVGTYLIVYEASDAAGNTIECSFTIEVIDTEEPVIVCPPNLTVGTDTGVCEWESPVGSISPLYNFANCDFEVLYEITGATMAMGMDDASGETFNLGTSTVTYTITETASNQMLECSFTVTVVDDEAPVLVGCSQGGLFGIGNQTFVTDPGQCSRVIPGSFSATDNCALAPIGFVVFQRPNGTFFELELNLVGSSYQLAPTNFEVGQWNYTITIFDVAGNSGQCLGQFQVIDTELPVITCPTLDATYDNTEGLCGYVAGTEFDPTLVSDNCEFTYTHNYGPWSIPTSLEGAYFPAGTTVVLWTVTDASGNTATCEIVINVVDSEDPVFVNCPEGVTYTIGADADCENGIIWSIPIAEDNCEVTVVQTAGPMQGMQLSLGTYEIQYTATDAAGNTATCNFTIVVEDDDAPYLVCQPDRTVSTDEDLCSWESAEGELNPLLVRDNCPGDVLEYDIDFADGTNENGLGNVPGGTIFALGVNTITYTLTDTAGTSRTCSFDITVFDLQAPEIMCPEDVTLECADADNDMLIAAWIDSATATDNCPGEIEIVASVFFRNSQCGDTETILYRFVATDAAGNTSECFANVVIEDTTPPSIDTEAQDIIIQCDGTNNVADLLAWLNNNGGAVATDLCGNVSWSNNYNGLDGDCGLTGAVEVIFTATDECGNSSTSMATFTIIDEEVPFWEILPQDLNIECDGSTDPYEQINAWLSIVGGAEAEDNCSFVMYSNDFDGLDGGCSAFTGSALVTFTATDACGNFVTAQATVNVLDNVGPTFVTMARDTIVECDGEGNEADLLAWLENNAGAEAFDLCSEPLTWFNELVSFEEGCGNTSIARYRFWAVDECENPSVFTEALFTIVDTTAPVFDELPETLVVECDGSGNTAERDAWLENNANLIASDVCGEIASIEYDLVSAVSLCGLTGTQLYRFTIVDECGNTATAEASFIIEDTTPPVITGGEDMTMEECITPPAGNYPEFDFWLTNNAGATATDVCGEFSWSNNFNPANWIQQCGNTRFVDVTFYATDVCGNVDSITHRFAIGDMTPPVFTNCPRPPIIVSAPDTWCSAFVNFSPVAATDNCSAVTINQIDTTGLGSGSLFPVGLTILEWEAVDECDNRDTCILKIVVNDFHTPPTISCPGDRQVNTDPSMCGAVVNGIAPFGITDNCPDNLAVTYLITDNTTGEIIADGILNASGFKFPEGQSTVLYRVADQPILLITEIINDGTVTGVEITNFGPTNYNISCLTISREGPDSESYEVPNGVVLAPGEVYTQNFTDIPAGTPVGYYISFLHRIIDGVALNGYTPVNFDWAGDLTGDNIIRIRIWDTDSADDYRVVNDCDLGSYGFLNPELTGYIFPANGATTALQSEDPSIAECSFVVTVIDNEPPYCAEYEIYSFEGAGSDIGSGFCAVSTVLVNQNFLVGDINILDLIGQYPNMGELTMRITSPAGTQVVLVNGQCPGTANFDVNFDDEADDNLTTIVCGPLGQGGTYQPLEALKAFFGENAFGIWTLEIFTNGQGTGVLNGWTLELKELVPYSQMDVTLENDPGLCGAEFTWTHPVFADNCCEGSISVFYDNEDGIVIPGGGLLPGNGGQMVTRFFPVGTTRVRYVLVDQFGNTSECGFDVTVVDVEDPVIVFCPPDVTIQLNPGECESLYNYPNTLATDNCGVVSIVYDPLPGHQFQIGTTTVLVTVSDEAGNTATCEFDVTVLEFIPTTSTMACNGEINLSLGPDCIAFIHPDMILEGDFYGCYDNYCVTITTGSGHVIGTSFDSTNFVTEEHIGMSLMVTICEDCNDPLANCCWGIINIEHKLIPGVACPDDVTIECNETGDPEMTGMPELLNCSPGATITYFDVHTINDECGNPRAVIDRVWSVRTAAGDVINCVQEITVRPFRFDNIVWPQDFVRETSLDCSDVEANPSLTHPNNTGWPTINGSPIIGHHLCEFNIGYSDEILTDANCEGAYEILRTWTIRNECEPLLFGVNPFRYIQAIKVNDRRAPVVKDCPADITVSTGTHICRAHVDLGNLRDLAFDECGDIRNPQVLITGGSITEFPIGSGNTRITN
jgi:hypothetical protein